MLFFAGANLNCSKFAPATTRVVAGRKPGENALAMDRSALRHGPFAYPPDKDPGIAPPSESGDDDGSVSHGESDGRPSPSLYKMEMRGKDAKVCKDGCNSEGADEDCEEDDIQLKVHLIWSVRVEKRMTKMTSIKI